MIGPELEAWIVLGVTIPSITLAIAWMWRVAGDGFDRSVVALAARYGATPQRGRAPNAWTFELKLAHGLVRVFLRRHDHGMRSRVAQRVEVDLSAPGPRFSAPICFSDSTALAGLEREFGRRFTLQTDDRPGFIAAVPSAAQLEFARLSGWAAAGELHCDGHRIDYVPGVDLIQNFDAVMAVLDGVASRVAENSRRRPC